MAIKRLNYFNGQFLKQEEFIDEQAYHRTMRLKHNQRVHTPGVVYGLKVTPEIGQVTIEAGMAIDSEGRELILEESQPININTLSFPLYLTIAYVQELTNPVSSPFPGPTRITESAVVNASIETPSASAIVLARVTGVGGDGTAVLDEEFMPKYSSPVINGDLKVSQDLTVVGKVAGNLTIENDLTVQGNLTVQGETTVVRTERMQGNVVLGDADVDLVTVEGRLQTGHSSGSLQISSPVSVTGTVTATSFVGNATDATKVLKAGDTMTGPLSITASGTALTVNGNVGIGTVAPRVKLEVAGAIMPAAGNTAATGILFPPDPGGGALDSAWIRYYARTGESTTLEIGTSNDPDDHIALMPSGNVGIGTTSPSAQLHVAKSILSGPVLMPMGGLVGSIAASGPGSEFRFARRTLTAWPSTPAAGDFFSWYCPDSVARLWTPVTGDLLSVTSGGFVGIGTTSPEFMLDVASRIRVRGDSAANTAGIWFSGYATGNQAFVGMADSNSVGFWGNTGAPGWRLTVNTTNGDLAVTGSATINNNLRVTGNTTLNGSLGFTNSTTPMMYMFESGSANPERSVIAHSRAFPNWGLSYRDADDAMIFQSNGSPVMEIGLGSRIVSISGNLTITGNAFKPGGGAWGASSDKRLKKNIAPLNGALDKLLQLRGVAFEWKEPEKQGNLTGTQMGLIAQEVEEVFPEWVGTEGDGGKTVTIRGFEALTVEALRELTGRVGALEEQSGQRSKSSPLARKRAS